MPCLLICLSAFTLFCLQARAGSILTVNVGGADIKLPCPAGMVDVPKDDPLQKAAADLAPPGSILLRFSISSDALDNTKPPDHSKNILKSRIFALKDTLQDIDDSNFVDFVQREALQASHGVLLSQDSSFDYVETQKQLDAFQKDSGIHEQNDSSLYSLGIISHSDDCVAYLEAQYIIANFDGKDQRLECLDVVAYLHLKNKVVVAVTSLIKNTVFHEDILTLKHAAEKYQNEVREINNT